MAEFAVRDSAGVRIAESSIPRWRPGEAWTLSERPILEIRGADGGDEDAVLLDPGAVYRSGTGEYVVADGMFAGWNEVLLFDRRGRYVRSIGREGRGPGEFGQLWWVAAYRGDSIAAYDYADHSVAIYARSGAFGRELRLPNWFTPGAPGAAFSEGAVGAFPDGSVLAHTQGSLDPSEGVGPAWFEASFLRVAADGRRWDTLGTFGIEQVWWTGREARLLPFGLRAMWALHREDLYYGTGDAFEVRVLDGKGTLRSIVRRHHERRPVTAADLEEVVEWLVQRTRSAPREGGGAAAERQRRRLAEVRPPEFKPVFSHLLVDEEGNLWVENYRWVDHFSISPRRAPTEWSVFGPEGQWLGQVEVPPGLLLRAVGSDYAIGFYQDEYDVEHIRVHALEKT